MLKVNESTIKRWADSNVIKCIRTPGGHRKFRIEDILEHANAYDISLPQLSDEIINSGKTGPLRNLNPEDASKTFAQYIVKGDADEAYHLLYSLYLDKTGLPEIFDKVVKSSFGKISELWDGGSKGVDDEHIATSSAMQALYKLESAVDHSKHNNRTVICAGLENELHSVGLLCVKIALVHAGYKVIYPGTNLPLKSLEDLIKKSRPDAVCISTTVPEQNKKLRDEIEKLYNVLKKQKILFLAGGSNSNIPKGKEDIYCSGISDLIKKIKKNK